MRLNPAAPMEPLGFGIIFMVCEACAVALRRKSWFLSEYFEVNSYSSRCGEAKTFFLL